MILRKSDSIDAIASVINDLNDSVAVATVVYAALHECKDDPSLDVFSLVLAKAIDFKSGNL